MTTRLAASATDVDKIRDELSRFTLRSSLRNPHPPRRNLKCCIRVTPKARTLPGRDPAGNADDDGLTLIVQLVFAGKPQIPIGVIGKENAADDARPWAI
jgi:hypothetical protein